jgi:cytochrome d ubiquinol oxidase subunit I
LGVYSIVLFGWAFVLASRRRLEKRAFLRVALWSLPLPWIAGALGWIVSEAGRGPWLLDGLLPVTETYASRSAVVIGSVACLGIAVIYAIGMVLLVRLVRRGPEELKFWPAESAQARKY